MRSRLQHLLAEYGGVALAVYTVIFLAVLIGSWAAIQLGWRPEGGAGGVGAATAAYLFTKVTQPLRIAATLALTPLAARLYRRAPTPAPAAGGVLPASAPPPLKAGHTPEPGG